MKDKRRSALLAEEREKRERERELEMAAASAAAQAEGTVIAIHSLDEWTIQIEEANSAKKLVIQPSLSSSCSFLSFFLFLLSFLSFVINGVRSWPRVYLIEIMLISNFVIGVPEEKILRNQSWVFRVWFFFRIRVSLLPFRWGYGSTVLSPVRG